MSYLSDCLQRTIATDGKFVYNCGYRSVYRPQFDDVVKNIYDIVLIGMIGEDDTVEIPDHFCRKKIKLLHRLTVYENIGKEKFAENRITFLPSVPGSCWWDKENAILPSPEILRPNKDVKFDRITLGNVALSDKIFQYARVRSVSFPSLSKVPSRAFYGSGLCEIHLPFGVKEIGTEAFSFCACLKRIWIPNTVKRIQSAAFRESGLSSVILPKGIERIREYTFAECNDLKAVVLPQSVKHISPSAFDGSANVHLVGPADSYIESFSARQGIPFYPYELIAAEIAIGNRS